MDAGKKARVAFKVVTWSVTALVVTVWAAGVTGLAVLLEQWQDPLFILLGMVVGICLGAITDRKVFQISLAAILVVSVLGALWLSAEDGVLQGEIAVDLYPFLAAAIWTFAAVFALARLWSRERPEPMPTPEEIDEAVARPRMGV